MDNIRIIGACEHNLKNISVEIPKKQITVFTGVSGSGKSSLCMDTIAAESRRELNETFPSFVQQYLPKYNRPHVGIIENLPITMILDQKKPMANSRSTIATYTDIYAFLRLLYSRIGQPFVGYSDFFSFNHPSGQCIRCSGLGEVNELDIHKLVDFNKCLNDEGVIGFPAFTTGAWRWKRYAYSGFFDLNKRIADYSKEELELFLYSPQVRIKNPPSNWPKSAKFEGIFPRMYRSIINTKEGKKHEKILEKMVHTFTCPDCLGSRVNEKVRSCKINDLSIADLVSKSIPEIITFINSIEHKLADDLKEEIIKRLQPLNEIGLGYLTLSRGMSTLSGGEAQRIKIAKYINSALTDVVYVLDERSVGLHVHDIIQLKNSILKLRNRGNTILIVEHHKGIIEMADNIIDLGPSSGTNGGEIMFSGTYDKLLKSNVLTGKLLNRTTTFKKNIRSHYDSILIKADGYHNLKNIDISIPKNSLSVIAGVAGSGKTSLMDCIKSEYEGEIVYVSQKDIGRNSRSTPATYLDISNIIRKLFSKENNVSSKLFSFNSEGGCPVCKGKGVIVTEMGFMNSIETLCDVCDGKRYKDQVLKYKYKGKNISEVFDLTVDEASEFFSNTEISSKLKNLQDVGLGYIHLNQSMTTLSGGELQRIKLASQINKENVLYLLDEPTSGLHLNDVIKLMELFNRLVDDKNTVIIIEHHLEIMKDADYLIELGPGGGKNGGQLLYSGIPKGILNESNSVTAKYLYESL